MPNRLIHETSPYLQQHANNPVDWYPWGPEAFARAKAEDKPLLLSVGYSACHWCHVMERESFENEAIAKQMNEDFVCMKVDREERPDVDAVYMQAVMAQTGRGGWPMTVFLTPDAQPFFGGTYFPPEDRQGMPAFPRVLQAVAEAYRNRRDEVLKSAAQLADHVKSGVATAPTTEPLSSEVLRRAFNNLRREYDKEYGGFGQAPKFPQPMALEYLLRYFLAFKDPEALSLPDHALEKMARGGVYDQLGGGFHRYSTDPMWLVPHFEKMLYDNALLSRIYLHAHLLTDSDAYRRIAEETLDYVLREMTSPKGGFYSTQDADSEGEEGKYYVWTPGQVQAVLGDKRATEVFCRFYGMTYEGNFDGSNILSITKEVAEVTKSLGISQEDLGEILYDARTKLLQHRLQHRIPPPRDEKVITAWNGMMLRSFAEAAAALNSPQYLAAAVKNADFLLAHLKNADGRLLRTYKDGQAKLKGYLEDYANLADGLLALHEATFDLRWLRESVALANQICSLFWSESDQCFYDTGADHEQLIVRPRDVFDNATPSGGAVAADVLLRLAVLTGKQEYHDKAAAALRGMRTVMTRSPLGFAHWLCALSFYLGSPKEIAVVGPREDPATQALLAEVYSRYLPNKVLTGFDPANPNGAEDVPLLEDKYMLEDKPSAFVCQNYACLMPATEPEQFAEQLAAG